MNQGRQVARRISKPVALVLLQALWVFLIIEVDQFLAAKTGVPFNRLPTLIAPFLIYLTATSKRPYLLFWPLVVFVTMHLLASLIATNAGLARTPFKYMVYITLLMASISAFADTPAKLQFIWKVHLLSFVWFAVQGIPAAGKVMWHSLLGNEDSFGPLMVIGMSVSYFYSVMTTEPKWKWIGRITFMLCVVGLVISFARGAAIGGALVLLHVLVFSKHRTRTIGFMALAALILIPLVYFLVPVDAYIKEIASSGEGDPVRMHLWDLAIRVFKTSPIWGVGAGNYGVIGESIATPVDHAMVWGSIYYRLPHSAFFQILSEEGIIGVALWAIMIGYFVVWNMRLRRRASVETWRALGGRIDLVSFSRGLDGAMLGFLTTSFFYNQVYVHWFWSPLILSFVLHRMVVVLPARQARAAMPRPGTQRPGFRFA